MAAHHMAKYRKSDERKFSSYKSPIAASWKMNYIVIIAVTFISVSICTCENYTSTIYVDPSTGEDSQTCLTANSPSSPCANLTWVLLRSESHISSTHFVLSEGTHYLREPTSPFQDLTSLALTGNSSVVSCTQPETGLAFVNVVGIVFSDVSFENCSAIRNSTSKNFLTYSTIPFRVALYFYLCESISMSRVNVTHSPNATGVVVYDTNGTNIFTNSNFSHNTLSDAEEEYPGGGGFYVEFTYCPPGVLECDTPTEKRNDGASYTFEECEFSHNIADNLDSIEENTYIFPYKLDHQALGRGGGLSLFVRSRAHGIRFTISKSKFQNNTASWGAGLFVEFHDSSYGNMVTVKASEFSDNLCPYTLDSGTAGAAIRLAHYIYGFDHLPKDATRNEIVIEDGNFTNNTAMYGAGISISLAPQNSDVEQLVFIHVCNASFQKNMAKLGGGIHVDRFWTISQGLMPRVWIEDTTFDNNTDQYFIRIRGEDKPYQIGYGIVCLTSTSVWFRGNVSFTNGLGSALAVAGGTASFNGSYALFEGNYANKGAAIALTGASTIEVGYNTRMVFRNNTAETKGGAINVLYISRENLVSDSKCFIRHVEPSITPDMWNVSIKFIDNKEKHRNNAIYTTSLLPCFVIGGSGTMMNRSEILCWEGWEYISGNKSEPCKTHISSDIGQINHTGSDPGHVKAVPGWEFDLPISTHDDMGKPLPFATVFTAGANDSGTDDSEAVHAVVVYGKRTSLNGKENSMYKMTLETLGERVWYVDVFIDMQRCPPGFKHSDDGVCACANIYGGILECNFKAREARLMMNTWMGLVTDTYYTVTCPRGYCNDSSLYHLLPNCSEALEDVLCAPNRKGMLCGECVEGHGPSVNSKSFQCVNCTDIDLAVNITKYVASVYIPLVALFLTLIFFDIRLTNGPANAFILYCQVVSGSFGLDAEGTIPLSQFVSHPERWLAGITLPYGVFNLEFVEGYIPDICFSMSFNTLTALCLDYLVALSPLLMIMVIVAVYKCKDLCCRCCSMSKSPRCLRQQSRNIGGALLPAFASFILLSYTKFSTVSTYIVTTRPLIDENGTIHSSNRVFLAGHLLYSSTGYYPYFMAAIFVFATFVAIPPLLLLDYPVRALEWLVSKSRHLERIYPGAKIHILLDTFQGCYRKDMRFFAGLYFLYRLITNILYIFCTSVSQQFAVQQVMCLLMVVLVGLLRPYRRNFLNYVDCLIFANLAVVNCISHYLLEQSQFAGYLISPATIFYFQYILVFLPSVYMLAYIIWSKTKHHHHKIKSALYRFRLRYVSPPGYQQLDSIARDDVSMSSAHGQLALNHSHSVNAEPKSDIEAFFDRAEERNQYQAPLPVTVVGVRQDSWGDGDASVRQTSTGATRDSGMLLSNEGSSCRTSGSGGAERSYGSIGQSSRISSNSACRSDSGN